MIRELTERLRENGRVSPEDIDAALRAKAVNGGSLALNLVLRGAIDEELLADFYCEVGRMRRASAGEIDAVSSEVFSLIPIEIVYDTGIVPLHLVSEERLAVGVVDPTEPERLEEAEFFAGYAFEPRVISVTQMAGTFERLAGHPWKVPLDELARALHARTGPASTGVGDADRELFRTLAELEPLLESRMADFDPRESVTVQIEALDSLPDALELTPQQRREPGPSHRPMLDSWESEPVDDAPDDVVELSPAQRKSEKPPPPVPVEARSSRGSGARARSRGEAEVASGMHGSVEAGGVIVSDSLVGVAAVESPTIEGADEQALPAPLADATLERGTPEKPLPESGTNRPAARPAPDHPTQRTMRLTGADKVAPARPSARLEPVEGPEAKTVALEPVSADEAPPARIGSGSGAAEWIDSSDADVGGAVIEAVDWDAASAAPPEPSAASHDANATSTPPEPLPPTASDEHDGLRDSNTWGPAEPGASLRSTEEAESVASARRLELQTPGEAAEPRFVPTRGGGDVSDFQGRFGPPDGVLERTGTPSGATRAAFRIAAKALATVASRDDIATELVESLGLAYPNVLVLSLRLPDVVIWGASIERGSERLVGERFHVQPGSVWERVVSESVAFHGRLAVRDPLRRMLGRDLGDETLVLPLTMKRRTVALLALDCASRPQLPPAAGQFASLSSAVHDAFRRVILSQKRSLRKA